MVAPSMVLFEIDAPRLTVFELERDTPGSIDVDRIVFRIESMQGVKVETWDVHFLGPDGYIETVKPRKNAFTHFRIDFRTPALRPQFRKGFALEGSDHWSSVSKQLTFVKQRECRSALDNLSQR
jgi:hypothetical protein